jgi:alpha-tubulin suppressor-like RCC1 family protein
MQTKLVLRFCVVSSLLCAALPGLSPCAHGQTDVPVLGEVIAWGDPGLTNVPSDLTNVVAIAAGAVHSLALTRDGIVRAWGGGSHGETNVPPGLNNVVGIAAAGFYANNYGYSLALKADGTVAGWGAISPPSGLSNVVAVAAGAYWWMALHADGTVASDYPSGTSGLLTLGGAPVSNVVAVACGDRHCLALRRNGTVVGWGRNYYGEATGVPSGNFLYSNDVVTLDGQVLSNVVAIAAGASHSVAVKSDGSVIAWGNNQYGQTDVPPGLDNIVAVAKGGNEFVNRVLALTAKGTLVSWGGSSSLTNVPAGLSNVVAVAVGSAHSLALVGSQPPLPGVVLSEPTWTPSEFSLRVPTQSGGVYSLEYRNALGDGAWTPLPLTAGDGHMQTLTDPNATDQSRFYRVGRW